VVVGGVSVGIFGVFAREKRRGVGTCCRSGVRPAIEMDVGVAAC
jgi:hypothetical protein